MIYFSRRVYVQGPMLAVCGLMCPDTTKSFPLLYSRVLLSFYSPSCLPSLLFDSSPSWHGFFLACIVVFVSRYSVRIRKILKPAFLCIHRPWGGYRLLCEEELGHSVGAKRDESHDTVLKSISNLFYRSYLTGTDNTPFLSCSIYPPSMQHLDQGHANWKAEGNHILSTSLPEYGDGVCVWLVKVVAGVVSWCIFRLGKRGGRVGVFLSLFLCIPFFSM